MRKGKTRASDTAPLFESGSSPAKPRNQKGGGAAGKTGRPSNKLPPTPSPLKLKHPTYYLPISQLRAQVFLAQGLIFPALYDDEDLPSIRDVQGQMPQNLLLYKEEPGITKDELLFRLTLTADELADAQDIGFAVLLPMPVPISRLLEIAVPATSLNDIERYIRGWIVPDVPVPVSLFTSATSILETSAGRKLPLSELLPSGRILDIEKNRHKYNKIMGLFAYMRNGARYHSATLGLYGDYPAQFFHLAAMIHRGLAVSSAPHVTPSVCLQAIVDETIPVPPITAEVVELVTNPGVFLETEKAARVSRRIQDATGENQHVHDGFKLLLHEDYKAAIRLLQADDVPEEAMILAVLYKFSDRNSNDRRNLKQTLHVDWGSIPSMATMLGVLGAYYGYRALDAREARLYALDQRLAEHVDTRPPIKFHLESQLERELIEAIYQWSFHNRKFEPDMRSMFEGMPPKPLTRPKPLSTGYWRDDSYEIGGMWVRFYRLSTLGRCLQRLQELPVTDFDEKSILGQFLMPTFFFHGEEHGQFHKHDSDILYYRIRKQKVIDLLAQEKVRVNLKMLNTAIEEETLCRK